MTTDDRQRLELLEAEARRRGIMPPLEPVSAPHADPDEEADPEMERALGEVDELRAQGKEPPMPAVAGSKIEGVNLHLMKQIMATSPARGHSGEAKSSDPDIASAAMAMEIAPSSPLEGMLVAQMVACHNATMYTMRLASRGDCTFEWRDRHLSQANKLMRSYTTMLQALDKHRGKGQQTVRVEHIHVHNGGQAVVGDVSYQPQLGGASAPQSLSYTATLDVPMATLLGEVEGVQEKNAE